jgi:extracellular factor (EF) 3-hydroxypalmitic acid methyl ester biosynthesis protein
MNHTLNGNSNRIAQLHAQPKPELTQAQISTSFTDTSEALVIFQNNDGAAMRGTPLKMTRHLLIFEINDPSFIPQLSESLKMFQIMRLDEALYSGNANVRNILNDGIKATCEVELDENNWSDTWLTQNPSDRENVNKRFSGFMREWQKAYFVIPEYKLAIADLQNFMLQLRLWLAQVEAKFSHALASDRVRLENEMALELRPSVIAALNSLFEQFEIVSKKIEPELLPFHRAYGRRHLHSLILASPFMHRTYTKPLGYAGDYEMMNMIVRNGLEGNSLFAKLINAYLLDQPPCHAVRNRVCFLKARIFEEANRLARQNKGVNIFSVACGPAWEAINFVAEHPWADKARIELLDFNQETLQRAGDKMTDVIRKHNRRTQVKPVKNSVQNLLRAKVKNCSSYDIIYCSGLYDYLSDAVCLALNTHLYDMLSPGGSLVVGNFAAGTPGRNLMEHLMDWFLIYRNPQELLLLAPEQAKPDHCRVRSETAAANLFLEVRKPE